MTEPAAASSVFAGGESAFAALTERYRRELHVHCYRMLASFEEAEDAVQETFLRAWRARDDVRRQFAGPRLAVPDRDERLPRHDPAQRRDGWRAIHSFAEVPWLTPYPDRLLDEVAPSDDEPDAVVVERETIELAFLAALQVLPPRQRATLIARDVLGWPASETASALDTSVPAVNSALQRARATMGAHLGPRRRIGRPASRPLRSSPCSTSSSMPTNAATGVGGQCNCTRSIVSMPRLRRESVGPAAEVVQHVVLLSPTRRPSWWPP